MIITDIAQGVWETIYSMLTSIANNTIGNMIQSFGYLIPSFGNALHLIADLFNLVLPACVYCFDAMLISNFSIYLIINVIIFKITGKFAVWWVKVVLDWWHKIAP